MREYSKNKAKIEGGIVMKNSFLAFAALAGVILIGFTGCASKGFVQEQIAQAVDPVKSQAEANNTEIAALKTTTAELSENQQKFSKTAEEALARANQAFTHAEEAGKLAKGKLLFEVTFTDESVHFGFDMSDLTDEAKAALDYFAERVKTENKSVYIEIQGHTDSIGTEEYNLMLGMSRAKAAKKYLYAQHGIPLHRISCYSYGELKPVVENDTSQNRAVNRRITLVVIE